MAPDIRGTEVGDCPEGRILSSSVDGGRCRAPSADKRQYQKCNWSRSPDLSLGKQDKEMWTHHS